MRGGLKPFPFELLHNHRIPTLEVTCPIDVITTPASRRSE
jgi:hypothetical protein